MSFSPQGQALHDLEVVDGLGEFGQYPAHLRITAILKDDFQHVPNMRAAGKGIDGRDPKATHEQEDEECWQAFPYFDHHKSAPVRPVLTLLCRVFRILNSSIRDEGELFFK